MNTPGLLVYTVLVLLIAYRLVATYLGGEIRPGSDMAGSAARWATVAEIEEGDVSLAEPPSQPRWLFRRAVALHGLLKDDNLDHEQRQRTPLRDA